MVILLGPSISQANATQTGIVIVLYINPTTNSCGTYGGTGSSNCWQAIINVKNAHPNVPIIALINPSSGPGSSQSSTYVTGIANMKANGVKLLGYVFTSYCGRALSTVEGDIDKWKSFYPNIDGIHFDEMKSTSSSTCSGNGGGTALQYYKSLADYVHAKPFALAWGNPGTSMSQNYVTGSLDNFHIYESSGLPSLSTLSSRTFYPTYDKTFFSYVAYNISTLDDNFVKNSALYVSYEGITIDNTYHDLPNYLLQQAADLDVVVGNVPNAPTLNNANTLSTSSQQLHWSAPTGATWYRIDRASPSSGTFTTVVSNTTNSTTQYTFTSLTAGTQYSYKVWAGNSTGLSNSASNAKTNYTTNIAPTSVSFTNIGSTSLRILWVNPTGNFSGFKIEKESPVGGGFSTVITNTNNSTNRYDLTSLTPNTQYNVRVSTNYDSVVTSPSVASSTFTSHATPPAPTINNTNTISPNQIRINWSASTGATWYKINRASPSGGTFTTIVGNTTNSTTHYDDTSVLAGTQYSYQIRAGNGTGLSDLSNIKTNYTSQVAPTSLSITQISNTKLRVAWANPTGNFSGFKIEKETPIGGGFTTATSNTNNATNRYDLTGLLGNRQYNVRVSTNYDSTLSTVSSTANGYTLPGPPTTLTATATSANQIRLSWTAPADNGTVSGYFIERSLNGGTSWSSLVPNTGNSTTHYDDTGLTSSTTYTYRASTIKYGGTSAPSNIASATTDVGTGAPGPPTSLVASPISPAGVHLTWNTPSSSGGSPINGYKIEDSQDNSTWSTIIGNTTNTLTTNDYSALTRGTLFYFRVSALNSIGPSPPSNIPSITTYDIPSKVTDLNATKISYREIDLTWTAPSNGGQPIVGYDIDNSIDGGLIWSGVVDNTGTATTSYADTSLSGNKTYTFRVFAINSVGEAKLASNNSTATTDPAPPSTTCPLSINITLGLAALTLLVIIVPIVLFVKFGARAFIAIVEIVLCVIVAASVGSLLVSTSPC